MLFEDALFSALFLGYAFYNMRIDLFFIFGLPFEDLNCAGFDYIFLAISFFTFSIIPCSVKTLT